jgi:hypothetical protein
MVKQQIQKKALSQTTSTNQSATYLQTRPFSTNSQETVENQQATPNTQAQVEQTDGLTHSFGNLEIQPVTKTVVQPQVQMKGESQPTKMTPEQIKDANRIRKARGLPLVQSPQPSIPQNQKSTVKSPPPQVEQQSQASPNQQPQPVSHVAPINTWDSYADNGKGAFVDATIPESEYDKSGYKDENKQKDGRNFQVEAAPSNGINLNNLLKDGKISIQELKSYTQQASVKDVARLDPFSSLIRNILKYPLCQSWHLAKEHLALSESKTEQALMRKLWEFRQWHYKDILKKTQAQVNSETKDPKGLTDFPSAGSTSLTSDIDVNLKGTQTETAVRIFNKLFKEDGWSFEAGVVYDVNVYALDFMHAFAGVDAKQDDGKVHKLTGKEGQRRKAAGHYEKYQETGDKEKDSVGKSQDKESKANLFLEQGGFQEKSFAKLDAKNQEEWSLVKLRIYMSDSEWEDYKKNVGFNDGNDKSKKEIINNVEAKYKKYVDEMKKGKEIAEKELNEVAEKIPSDNHEHQDVVDEQLKIGGSNRVYEEKLKTIKELRLEIGEHINEYNELVTTQGVNGIEVINGLIEMKLKKLRQLVSEAALFSNEAYITDGAVNHAVVGLQGGNQIEQSKTELMNAVTENLADSLKEIARHGKTFGEAGFKSAKYYMRMADAIKNIGFSNIFGVNTLYDVGYAIAEGIKKEKTQDGQELSEKQKEDRSEEVLKTNQINDIEALKKLIIQVGTDVRNQFDAKVKNGLELGKIGPKKGQKNTN